MPSGNIVSTPAFIPDYREHRIDGAYETSINWKDDEDAIPFAMTKREQSRFGLAILERSVLDAEKARTSLPKALDYERKIDPDDPANKYHGNIIFVGEKRYINMIAAALALKSKFIPRPD